ncbi:MAG: hypothetical protein HYT76_06510 [Deltaproteobacteria bacterium]|nr:hypothetical protein [Deltaproteobacteria bacterium]
MSYESIGKLIDKWMNDQKFRADFRKDPEEAIRLTGIKLNSEELSALKKIDWKRSDEELKSQISKGM